MPTFRHGKSTGFLIEDQTGTLVDVSTALREVTFPRTVDTPETTAFQSIAKTYVTGLPDGKFTIAGLFDATLDSMWTRMAANDGPPSGAAGDTYAKGKGWGYMFKYAPEGAVVGRTMYVSRVFVANYSVQGAVADLVSASIDLVFTGAQAYSADTTTLVRAAAGITALAGTDTSTKYAAGAIA